MILAYKLASVRKQEQITSICTGVKPTAHRHDAVGGWADPVGGCLICITQLPESAHLRVVVSFNIHQLPESAHLRAVVSFNIHQPPESAHLRAVVSFNIHQPCDSAHCRTVDEY